MSDSLIGQIAVPTDHPSLAGHFPGNPVVPGVVLLDVVLAAIQAQRTCALQSIPGVKFLQPVRAGEAIRLQVAIAVDTPATLRARFQGFRNLSRVFEGTFVLSIRPETAA